MEDWQSFYEEEITDMTTEFPQWAPGVATGSSLGASGTDPGFAAWAWDVAGGAWAIPPGYADSVEGAVPPSPSAPENVLPDHLAKRFSGGKARYDLIPPEALKALVGVIEFGAARHGEDNWQKGMPHRTTYASIMRHLQAWWAGENIDLDSGLPHTWHILWNAMAVVTMEHRLNAGDRRLSPLDIDNRPVLPKGLK